MTLPAIHAGHPWLDWPLDVPALLHQSPSGARQGGAVSDSQTTWERLATLLGDRRTRLAPQYKSRLRFAADTGLNERLVADLENARRTSYRHTTLTAVETAYRWAPGSISRVLDGGDPEELDSTPGNSTAGVDQETAKHTLEGLEAAARELLRRMGPNHAVALLGEFANLPPSPPASERRYEDDAEQHIWETPGLSDRERRFLIHQLQALRRMDETEHRAPAARPAAEVHEFRRGS
jgi:hypothetical protein